VNLAVSPVLAYLVFLIYRRLKPGRKVAYGLVY